MFLVGDQTYYTYAQLILPDGGKIRFDRISPGTGITDAVMECTTSPNSFYKARLTFSGVPTNGYFDVKVKDGTTYRFSVDAREVAPLSAIIDRNGNQLSVVRANVGTGDLQGHRITRLISPNGRWVAFTYDANFHITQAKDNIGRTINYAYDGSGRLTQVTDAGGGVTQYTYDGANRMLTIRDARGIVYLTNAYDTNGRITQQTQADSTTYQLAYTLDGAGKVTQTDVTDPRGNHRIVTFSSSGYALTDTKGCSCGSGVSYERQAGTNFVTAMTDALNRRTEYAYDSMGNVSSVTRMAGTSEAVTVNVTYESVFNRVASVTDALNHTTSYSYDGKGNLTGVTDALNHQTTVAYNTAGQPVSVTDPLGNTSQLTYDGGDLISVRNPLGQTGSRFVDAAGRVLSVTNPLGETTRFEYDSLNRMTRAIDPLQGLTQFSYDPNGNLLSLTDARNNVTSYVYNNSDRVQTRTDPLLHAESYQYNQNGSLTQNTDRKSQITNYTYDSLDRLSQVTYPDSSTITYSYDSVSRLTQVTDSISGAITYAYDNLDRLLSETTPLGMVSYTYDALGRRATMNVPGQSVVNYSYENANRLTQITQGTLAVQFSYDAASRRSTLTLPNGVVTEYSYNAASQLMGLTYKQAAVTFGNLSYSYDASGRRTSIGGSFARTGLPQALTVTNYNASNQQIGFSSQTLTYDNNGNLTSDGTNTYTWNARNKLVTMSASGLSANFQYDARGRRISKTINAATNTYMYDGANIVQEQVAGSANANTLTGKIDEVFSRTDALGTTSPLRDGIGSNIALADSTGVVQTQYTYEAFGKSTAAGPGSLNAHKYTGREDDGTGLYYYRARYYSPSLQRFISEDPIGLAAGANVYAYVRNNPVGFRDPSGLQDDGRDWSTDPVVGPYLAPPLGGRACATSPLRVGRAPDYYAFNGSLGSGAGGMGGGVAGQFVIDRYGNSYGAPGPGYIGSPGPGCSMTAGWLLQTNKPTRGELRTFLSEHTVSAGAGFIAGANLVWSPGNTFAIECGTMFPGWAITWQYDYESPNNSYFTPGMFADPVMPNKDRM